MSTSKQFTQALRQWAEVFMARSMSEWMRYVKACGLNQPQFGTLMRLYYRGECGLSDIRAHLDVTNAAASQMVDRLVQQGLLERVEDQHDRRAKQISLSPKGRALIEKGVEKRNQWLEELPARLTREQQTGIVAALADLTEAARPLETGSRRERE